MLKWVMKDRDFAANKAMSPSSAYGWILLAGLLCLTSVSNALPAFARQTGAACEQCHTVAFGPQLTPYGRLFKLNGYTWGRSEGAKELAVMVQATATHTAKDQPQPPMEHFSTNDNSEVDQVSLFYGGRISEHAGLFAQVTYSGEARALSWDNIDLRYARTLGVGGHTATVGVSINNNPTVQDLWNTTAAWGFPFISSSLAPTPATSTYMGSLGGGVLGSTVYAMVDGQLYVEAGGYRSLNDRWLKRLGVDSSANAHFSNIAPYLRVGVDRDLGAHHLHVGALRMDASVYPDPTQPVTDRYVDSGLDAMYQYYDGGAHSLTVNGNYIHEDRHFDASYAAGNTALATGTLNSAAVDATYAYRSTWAFTVGAFDMHGNVDTLYYPGGALNGSQTGSPDSSGTILQAEYIPFGKVGSIGRNWLNVRVGVQYVAYTQFNGARSNYDGAGRNAADNNTLFGYVWLMF